MKTFLMISLLLFLCSCGGGGGGGNGSGSSNPGPVPNPDIQKEAKVLEQLWSELHEDAVSPWHRTDSLPMTEFAKGIEFGKLVERDKMSLSFTKTTFICRLFIQVGEKQETPDFYKLAILTLKEN